jgi:hypothetical protein
MLHYQPLTYAHPFRFENLLVTDAEGSGIAGRRDTIYLTVRRECLAC